MHHGVKYLDEKSEIIRGNGAHRLNFGFGSMPFKEFMKLDRGEGGDHFDSFDQFSPISL